MTRIFPPRMAASYPARCLYSYYSTNKRRDFWQRKRTKSANRTQSRSDILCIFNEYFIDLYFGRICSEGNQCCLQTATQTSAKSVEGFLPLSIYAKFHKMLYYTSKRRKAMISSGKFVFCVIFMCICLYTGSCIT